jgi:RimJ/RimL family protein N-acetyltransferase
MITLINDRARDKELAEWIAKSVDVTYQQGDICFGTEKNGEVIGAVLFNEWNGSNVCAHQRMESAHAITRELLHTAFSYAFKFLKARRITGAVIGNNPKAVTLNLHLGFELDGVFKDYFPGNDGTITHFVMWPERCKYLGADYATA